MKHILTILLLFTLGVFAQSKSIYFNEGTETDDIIYQADNGPFVTGEEWTMEAWFKADDVSGSAERHLFRFDGGGQLYIVNDVLNGSAGYGATISANTWYHVAYVRTASSTTVYLDGALYASAGADPGSSNVLFLGAVNDYTQSSHFSGKMDEFRLWDVARTQAEIQNNKDNELVGNEPNLVIYYDFNNGSGNSSVADRASAGGNADGTLYRMEASDWSTDSPTLGAPLPVELTSFTASAVDGSVLLNWETTTEVNNYGFEIESSNDNVTFTKVGFVSGHGNSNSPNSYSFTATDGGKYYRLKQLDTDGGFEYSDVVEVEGNLSYKLSQNHPNPFNPTTTVNFTLPQSVKVNISVYNMLGQKVMEVANREFSAGNHSVSINASQLTSGMYFYKLETSDFSKTMKMMLLK